MNISHFLLKDLSLRLLLCFCHHTRRCIFIKNTDYVNSRVKSSYWSGCHLLSWGKPDGGK